MANWLFNRIVIPLCVHLHFYQPSRVDPFSQVIPEEYGCAPYSNFNEKINAECYRPNAQLGNIDRISFNLGPTLADWLEQHDTRTYKRYLDADKILYKQYGAGNAIAQAYNHVILPLLDDFDKTVQIAWGIADFESRFGHAPLGFWLPETAVDMATLKLLVHQGIRYIFLAPWQLEGLTCENRPYRLNVEGTDLMVLPYNDPLTRMLICYKKRYSEKAFLEYALPSHRDYAAPELERSRIITLAADGEFFGHHMKGREKLLAKLLQDYPIVYPFELLADLSRYPQLRLRENTSWSCFNQLKRWRGQCQHSRAQCIYKNECYFLDNSWTDQLWLIMDEVKQAVYQAFRRYASMYVHQPDRLIMSYVRYQKQLMTRTQLFEHAQVKAWDEPGMANLLQLLDAIYYVQLMFTSCGFFFEDVDRIEPKNNIKYLKKVMALAAGFLPEGYEQQLVTKLQRVKSYRHTRQSAACFYGA